jgi:hypothetical protein
VTFSICQIEKIMQKALFSILALLLLSGCFEPLQEIPDEVEGLAPIYGDAAELKNIVTLGPQPINSLFRIYYKDPYIFAGELSKGVHIIDNSDPTDPQKIAFLQIFGNSDVAIKGDLLYANNLNDLVTLDISDINNPVLVNRLEGAFEQVTLDGVFPASFFGFFECPDPDRGVVVGWEERMLERPQCWR